MSDLLAGPSSAGVGNGRAQNGGATSGPVPVPQPHYRVSGVRTPTDIMKTRQEREARKRAAESESRQRARNEEQPRPQQEGPTGTERRDDPAGFATIESRRKSGDPTSTRRSGEAPGNRTTTDRRSGERRSGGDPKIINQPQEYKSTAIVPATEQSNTANVTSIPQPSRRRGTSLSHDQPRPVQPSNRATSATHNTQQQQPQTRNTSTAPMDSRSQPNPPASNIPQSQPQPQGTQETNGGTSQQRGTTSSFPHAFERWETLSSHWEGLTSYWIRRLQNNSDEMNREPLNQQMARQVTDLSAAGANLFHAVVELQRLRASSERKFQRWFFDTRAEQERAREVQARLENELRSERQARAEAVAELNKPKADQYAAYQDQSVIDQMLKDVKAKDMEVKEMRRELQISKEEARRAWEELGRREQEERDRTTSLRAGEPTLVGGVQVVPMLQGAPSRQTSANRPSTRDGPLPSAPSALSGPQSVESPLDEPGVTHYDPARSETDTDPFTENGRVAQQPAHAPTPQQQTSNGSSAAVQAARSASYPTQQSVNSVQPQPTPSTSAGGGTYLRYGPGGATPQPPGSSFYQHEGSSLLPEGEQVRTTEPDDRSFVPSNDDTFSEEEFEYDGNGNVRRDAQGNPIVYGRGAGSEDSDEDDVQDQLDRERMYSERYGSGLSGVEYGSGPTSTAGPRGQSGRTSAQVYGGPLGQEGSTGPLPVDYSGSAYGSGIGWEAVPRHHHPTRLSDVLEEDERSRTSLSRASQTSRGLR